MLRSLYEHVKRTAINTFRECLPLQHFRMQATMRNPAWHLFVREPLTRCLPHYLIAEVHVIYEVRIVFFDNHSHEILEQDL